MRRVSILLVATILAIILFYLIKLELANSNVKIKSDKPKITKCIYGTTITGEKMQFNFSDYEKTILSFIDTSCDVCKIEIPELISFATKHQDFQLFLVSNEEIEDLKKNIKYDHPTTRNIVLLSISSVHYDSFKIQSTPSFQFLSKGVLVKEHVGKINIEKFVSNVF